MTSDRLKNLAKVRLILSVIAVFLAGLMIVSGVMHFVTKAPSKEAPTEPTETAATAPSETTGATEPSETTAPTETTSATEATEETEETTEETTESAGPAVSGGIKDGSSGSHDGNNTGNNTPSDNSQQKPDPDNSNGEGKGEGEGEGEGKGEGEGEGEGEGKGEGNGKVEIPPPLENITDDAKVIEAKNPSAPLLTVMLPSHPVSVTLSPAINNADTTDGSIWGILFWSSAALLALDLLAITLISRQIQEEKKRLKRVRKSLAHTDAHAQMPAQAPRRPMQPVSSTEMIVAATQVGTIHQMGRREYQQDSLGHTAVLNNNGLLAIVADGMGGLSGGEKVSQQIVMDALAFGHQLQPGQVNGALWKMVDTVNASVNRTLGPDGLYKSGSTLISVLVYDGRFQWISVGDSRIYLYRQGYANQLNQDHDQLQVWMADVLSGRRTMEETLRHPDGRKLTSFLGMGQLKYVDGSQGSIALEPGDRLLLVSDGVYNILNEDRLADVLKRYPDAEQAASVMDRMIRDSNHPHQDNYTAIILAF